MEAVLLTDFGSTYTKVTAVDLSNGRLLGTATAFTTGQSDVSLGQEQALKHLQAAWGPLTFSRRFACSSAAGGLRMVAVGLVPTLTAEAARLAALSAGAKVAQVYSYQLTEEDLVEIDTLNPDIVLLTGGTDGGNSDCILHNAEMLANSRSDFPLIFAGNRVTAAACQKILAHKQLICCPNVMPQFGKLNIEPVQHQIRSLFLEKIIQAKGLSREQSLISGILMPTPSAVKCALELLAQGLNGQGGLNDLAAVDLGGATTDIYSVAAGLPENEGIFLKGLPEPYSKRTVEGDIGMRYSAPGIMDAAGAAKLARLAELPETIINARVTALSQKPEALPQTPEQQALDFALAACAVETAMTRHAGKLEQVYTATGPAYLQIGKDLRRVRHLVLTGGAIIYNPRAVEIAAYANFSPQNPLSLRPNANNIYIDHSYILPAMGLLAKDYPEVALAIMTKELTRYGAAK